MRTSVSVVVALIALLAGVAPAFSQDACVQPPANQHCTASYGAPVFPDNNNNNPPRPFPIGTGASECACGTYSYSVVSTYNSATRKCKFVFTFTWEGCVESTMKRCYQREVATTYRRVPGAPACCGPEYIYQHHSNFVDYIDNVWYDITSNTESYSGESATTLLCASTQKWTISSMCPAYQSGLADPTLDSCDKKTAWSGDVVTIAIKCCGDNN